MGVRESDLDALTLKYGALKVTEGLDAMEAQINDTSENKILNRGAYLKAVLTNRFPDGGVPEPLSAEELRPLQKVDPRVEQQALIDAWRANRQKQIRAKFTALPEDEKVRWIDQAAPTILQSAEHDWESPLISRVVLDVYATARHGAGWKDPSEIDLVMFSVAEARQK